MATRSAADLSAAEKRRQQTLDRRQKTVADVVGEQTGKAVARMPGTFLAQTLERAHPPELIRRGLISMDQTGQPRVLQYDPLLLAANPQRGRVIDRSLKELAASLDTQGQQEPIVARLITETDRKRWPTAFTKDQVLVILKGHRIYNAQPLSKLSTLRVELMLPFEGEDDIAYSRRALRRAAVKMMHSQGYDIFDKVQQYSIWCDEFALEKPKDTEVAAYFEISRTEAQRVKAVAQMDNTLAQEIINSDRRPADEVIFTIANRPEDQQRDAYERYGHLSVAEVRRLEKTETAASTTAKVTGAGRPRNFVLAVRDEAFDVTYISTGLTARQWKNKGGSKAFWDAIKKLVNSKEVQERLQNDLN